MLSDFVGGAEGLPTNLEVKWEKDREYVQVGVRDLHNSWIQTSLPNTGSSSALSMLPDPAVVESLWVNFHDRASINAAIRLLRRARDGAFGRDE